MEGRERDATGSIRFEPEPPQKSITNTITNHNHNPLSTASNRYASHSIIGTVKVSDSLFHFSPGYNIATELTERNRDLSSRTPLSWCQILLTCCQRFVRIVRECHFWRWCGTLLIKTSSRTQHSLFSVSL